eukprot:g46690.t1
MSWADSSWKGTAEDRRARLAGFHFFLGGSVLPFCLKRNVSVALPSDAIPRARVEAKASATQDELVATATGCGELEKVADGKRLVPAAPEASSCEAEVYAMGIAGGRVADALGPKLGHVDLRCAIVNQKVDAGLVVNEKYVQNKAQPP